MIDFEKEEKVSRSKVYSNSKKKCPRQEREFAAISHCGISFETTLWKIAEDKVYVPLRVYANAAEDYLLKYS